MIDSYAALYAGAIQLHEHGINVVSIGKGKRPLAKWKTFQSQKQTQCDVDMMAHAPGIVGIAAVCGCDWNGLTSIDFDILAGYDEFRSRNAALARSAPTYRSGRDGGGVQVWVKSAATNTTKFQFGDIKGRGGLAICPPSKHPTGRRYEWVVPLAALPEVEIDKLKLEMMPIRPAGGVAESEENIESAEESREVEEIFSALSALSTTPVDQIIAATLPAVEGQRHRRIFELARRLKGHADYANKKSTALEPIVREWHRRALPIIGTKPWDDTWSEFLTALPRVRTPYGAGSVNQAFERACSAELPPAAAARYEATPARLLYLLCRELDRASRPEPFYLSNKVAADLLAIDSMQAWRYFKRMIAEGTLDVATSHTASRATRYRFTEDNA